MPVGSEVTVSIHIENQTPAEGLNTFVEGPYPFSGFTAGEYRGILSVNIPGVARDIHLDGWDQDRGGRPRRAAPG